VSSESEFGKASYSAVRENLGQCLPVKTLFEFQCGVVEVCFTTCRLVGLLVIFWVAAVSRLFSVQLFDRLTISIVRRPCNRLVREV